MKEVKRYKVLKTHAMGTYLYCAGEEITMAIHGQTQRMIKKQKTIVTDYCIFRSGATQGQCVFDIILIPGFIEEITL